MIKTMQRLFATTLLILALSPVTALYADIYRVVDKDGKVTFTDQPSENSQAENIQERIDEAVERNSAPSLESQRENDPEWVKKARQERENQAAKAAQEKAQRSASYKDRKNAWKAEVKKAKEDLKAARQAQVKGQDVIEGDYVGNRGGGARPSEQYQQRQLELEQDVIDAENALEAIRRAKPKP